jgi:prophage antirepressor-like protein
MRSRKPEAKAFKRWITHEVLPSIRKTGSYQMTRAKSKEYRKMFTNTLKLAGYEQPRQYQHTTVEMKRELGFPWKPKDQLSEGELRLVMASELIATERIARRRVSGFNDVHPLCVASSHGVAGMIEDIDT